MKTYRPTKGPFTERPYYTRQELERTCSEELDNSGLLPKAPEPIRIDRFIEKRFGITPVYEALPTGVLGWTRFGPAGVEAIVVARALSEEQSKTAERRVSTTLAHEAGHCLLHAHLFAVGAETESLFGGSKDVEIRRILCRDDGTAQEDHRHFYAGRWWEYQANQAMSALLLPKNLVELALTSVTTSRGSFGQRALPADRRDEAIAVVSERFDVNPIVARIRLGELYPLNQDGQLTL